MVSPSLSPPPTASEAYVDGIVDGRVRERALIVAIAQTRALRYEPGDPRRDALLELASTLRSGREG